MPDTPAPELAPAPGCQAIPGAARRGWRSDVLCASLANTAVEFCGRLVPVCRIHRTTYERWGAEVERNAVGLWGWERDALAAASVPRRSAGTGDPRRAGSSGAAAGRLLGGRREALDEPHARQLPSRPAICGATVRKSSSTRSARASSPSRCGPPSHRISPPLRVSMAASSSTGSITPLVASTSSSTCGGSAPSRRAAPASVVTTETRVSGAVNATCAGRRGPMP